MEVFAVTGLRTIEKPGGKEFHSMYYSAEKRKPFAKRIN